MVAETRAPTEQFDTPEQQNAVLEAIRRPGGIPVHYGPEEHESSIVDRFERMVLELPDNEVVRSTTKSLTYCELNRQANRIAHTVLQATDGKVQPVGLMFEHGVEMVAALLGVLKSRCFYVPLDPTYPAQRLKYMAEDTGLSLVITDDESQDTAQSLLGESVQIISIESLPTDATESNPGIEISPDDYAYILYTSGSTGNPKGVIENHRDVKWFAGTFLRADHTTPADVVSGFWSLSFSGLAAGLYMCLLGGATLLLIDPQRVGAAKLVDLIRSHKLTYLTIGPPLFRKMFEAAPTGDGFPLIRITRFGGSGANPRDISNVFSWARYTKLRHSLGASEIKHVASYILSPESEIHGETIPVGYPVEDVQVLLVDENGREVPTGEVGEIIVKSRFICPGYWNRPDLNLERFSGDENGGAERYYRSGDLGQKNSNGCLFLRGRKDFQIKIRGYRVEGQEVEENLKAIDGIIDAAVTGQSDSVGDTKLVAFIVPDGDMPGDSLLRQELSQKLPHYMVPSVFVEIDKMPTTPSGKLDRTALPQVELNMPETSLTAASPIEPTTETEKRLCSIWEDALHRQHIGVDEDYFELGGDSMMAAVIFDQIFRVFGRRIAINALFEAPTVAELAAMIDRVVPESTPVVPIRPTGSKTPIICLHSLGGSVLAYYRLATYFPPEYPVWAIQPRGVDGLEKPMPTIEEMARYYAPLINRIQEDGPLILTGISLGGTFAFEVARELIRMGREVEKLVLIDSRAPIPSRLNPLSVAWDKLKLAKQSITYMPYSLRGKRLPPGLTRARIFRSNIRAGRKHRNSSPRPVRVSTGLIRSNDNGYRFVTEQSVEKWRELTDIDLKIADVDGAHEGPENFILDEPNVQDVASQFLRLIQES